MKGTQDVTFTCYERSELPVDRRQLQSDTGGGEPDVLSLGALTLQVIERHGRYGIRVKDNDSPVRRQRCRRFSTPISSVMI